MFYSPTPLFQGGGAIISNAREIRERRIEREIKSGTPYNDLEELKKDIILTESDESKKINLTDGISNWMNDFTKKKKKIISTGFPRLDYYMDGLNPTDLIVLSARPSIGKTTFALNVSYAVAKQNKKVLYFNLEMSAYSLISKIFSMESNVSLLKLRDKEIEEIDAKKLMSAGNRIKESDLPFKIYDSGSITISQIVNELRSEADVSLLVIDQLLKIRPELKRDRRDLEIADITFSLKEIAKEFKIPVLLIHQTSREVEKRTNQIPVLSDLRDSGAIEQDADVVLFLHRDSYYTDDPKDKTMAVKIAKNKMGETGKIGFEFDGSTSKIREMTQIEQGGKFNERSEIRNVQKATRKSELVS